MDLVTAFFFPALCLQVFKVGILSNRSGDDAVDLVFILPDQSGDMPVPLAHGFNQSFDISVIPEVTLVLDCFEDAHRLGVVQQTNHRNVAPDKVRHPAIIRVADILRLTERLPRPTTETGADCPIFGFNRIRVDRQAEIGCLTPFAGPSGKGEGTARHDETVCLTNGDHAAALDEKPKETVIVGGVDVAGGSRRLYDLADLRHGKIKCRLPELLHQLPRLFGVGNGGSQGVVNRQAHRSCPR